MGKALKGIGKVMQVAAPFAGLIPGVGIPLGAALGAGGSALGRTLEGKKTFGNIGQLLMSGAGGALGSSALGGQGFRGLSSMKVPGILSTIGRQFKTPTGGLDFQKLVGAGLAAGQFFGGRSQRKAAERRDVAMDEARNLLLSRILQPQTYNFQTGA